MDVWDIRRRGRIYTIAAHTNLVSHLRFQREKETSVLCLSALCVCGVCVRGKEGKIFFLLLVHALTLMSHPKK